MKPWMHRMPPVCLEIHPGEVVARFVARAMCAQPEYRTRYDQFGARIILEGVTDENELDKIASACRVLYSCCRTTFGVLETGDYEAEVEGQRLAPRADGGNAVAVIHESGVDEFYRQRGPR